MTAVGWIAAITVLGAALSDASAAHPHAVAAAAVLAFGCFAVRYTEARAGTCPTR